MEKLVLRRKYKEQKKVKRNKCTTFLLPVFGWSLAELPEEFIESYIIHDNRPKLAMCFDNTDNEDLLLHIFKLQNHINFVESYFDDDDKEVVAILEIPERFLDDYDKFLDGKYSKFSKQLKDILIKSYGKKTCEGHLATVYDCINPNNDKRRAIAEYYSPDKTDINQIYESIKFAVEILDKPILDNELYRKTHDLKFTEILE